MATICHQVRTYPIPIRQQLPAGHKRHFKYGQAEDNCSCFGNRRSV